jgi:hypothetical protein
MRLPRVRFTVQRLMIVVAVVGVSTAYVGRCAAYLRRAYGHEQKSKELSDRWDIALNRCLTPDGYEKYRLEFHDRAIDHRSVGARYRHAAWRPWLPVSPDPPEPE